MTTQTKREVNRPAWKVRCRELEQQLQDAERENLRLKTENAKLRKLALTLIEE